MARRAAEARSGEVVKFADTESLSDFRLFLERSMPVTDSVVRLTLSEDVLRITVCTFAPFGLLDEAPTVLGMRIMHATDSEPFDALVSTRGMLDRIAHLSYGELELGIPPMRESAAWVGIDPPKGGWEKIGELDVALLSKDALAGIEEVAEALPHSPGDLVVRDVRSRVWNAPIEMGSEPDKQKVAVPRSVAFTGHMLGFLSAGESAQLFESGNWLRLSTALGHVLVGRRN